MTYLNKRTGNVIVVPCRLDGPDWEEITEAKETGKSGRKEAGTAVTEKTERTGKAETARKTGRLKKGADA